jgi:hypothetical protein
VTTAPTFDAARQIVATEWRRARDLRMKSARICGEALMRRALVRAAREANRCYLRTLRMGSYRGSRGFQP